MPPPRRITQSARMRKRLDEIFEAGVWGDGSIVDELVQRGLAYLVTKALEEELTDWLGRGHYKRLDGARSGHRNGYDNAQVKTESGKVGIKKPKVRDTEEGFYSRIYSLIKRGSERLTEKIFEMYVRGLSTRDIEEVFRDQDGNKLLSRTSVSQITEEAWAEYERFKKRNLSKFKIEYLFLDAVYEAIRREYSECEGILVAWAITSQGQKVLIDMELGNKESEDAWVEFLRDMVARGLNIPVLVVSDGAPGLIRAIKKMFPKSLRQRCLVHKIRNVLNKIPTSLREEVKVKIQAVYYCGDEALAKLLAQEVEKEYKDKFPSAMECFQRDFEACIAYMRCPKVHHRSIRTTNLLERSFLEEKRRTKIIPGFFTEKSALKLVFATLIRVQRSWNKVRMGEREKRRLAALKKEIGLLEIGKGVA